MSDLKLRKNNLFANGKLIQFTDGDQYLIREQYQLSQFENFENHVVKQNDDLTKIAYNYYKGKVKDASKYWWLIADVNDITTPYDLTAWVDKTIQIPDILEIL